MVVIAALKSVIVVGARNKGKIKQPFSTRQ